MVREVQETTLKYLCRGNPGYDETELLDQYRAFLCSQGLSLWDAQEAADLHVVLFVGDTGTSLQQDWPVQRGELVEECDEEQAPVDMDEIRRAWAERDAESLVEEPPCEYFVTISANVKFRRLHRTSVCSSIKGLCRRWEEVPSVELAREDARCRKCFKVDMPLDDGSSGESSASSSADDEAREEPQEIC